MRNIKSALRTAAVLTLAVSAPLMSSAQVNDMQTRITKPGASAVAKYVTLGLNKSMVVELGYPAADVVITNPAIADAVVQTANRLIIRGVRPGQTNAFVFDRNGNQLLNLEISVEVDMAVLDDLIARNVPGARVKVEGVNGNVLVTGKVDSLAESDRVLQLVDAYARSSEETKIINMIEIAAKDQVLLEVRIVEMQRSAVKQLGIRLTGNVQFGDLAQTVNEEILGFIPGTGGAAGSVGAVGYGPVAAAPFTNSTTIGSQPSFSLQGGALGGLSGNVGYTNYLQNIFQSSLGVAFDALERIGIVRTLAEPTIVAMSGETGNFLAGGEFPVPVGQDRDGNVTIEFKPFGVGLSFTPVVLSEGRISLKISTEVSELTTSGAFQGQNRQVTADDGTQVLIQSLTIPALSVRRAESVVEMPSGSSMMMAGLIQSKQRQALDQLPGIKKVPILGALFQSRDFINEDTELVVIITPYLVDPTQKNMLRTPADGYAAASDTKTVLFGKLNETYGKNGKAADASAYRAPVGFIEE